MFAKPKRCSFTLRAAVKKVPLRLLIPLQAFAIALVLGGFILAHETAVRQKHLHIQSLQHIRATLAHLQLVSETSLALENYDLLEQTIGFIGVAPEIDNVSLIDPNGRVQFSNLYALKQTAAQQSLADFDAGLFKQAVESKAPLLREAAARKVILAYFPVRFPQPEDNRTSRLGALYLRYDWTQPAAEIFPGVIRDNVTLLLVLAAAMSLLVYLLQRTLGRPLLTLAARMQSAVPGIAALPANGELAALNDAFEQLLQKLAESGRKLEIQKNLYSILSETNQGIVRIRDKQALCREICRIAVGHGGFFLAWIGFIDAESKRLEICAKAGSAQLYLEQYPLFYRAGASTKDAEPALRVLARAHSVIVNDCAGYAEGWRHAAQVSGIRSCAAFPILKFKKLVGVFAVYAGQADFFSGDIVRLLEEMSSDLSFAMGIMHLDAQRKSAEQALKEREENLSVTLHSIGDAFIVTDTAERIARMNPVAEQLTGWGFAEAENRPLEQVFKIVDARSRQPAENPVRKALAEGVIVKLSNHIALLSRDGCERQIADSAAPIRDARQNIIGAALVFRDVSTQYAMTAALGESEERFRHVNEATGGYIWETDTQGFYTYVSDKSGQVKGYAPEALLGRRLCDFIAGEDARKIRGAIAGATPDNNKFHLTVRNIAPSGEIFWEEMHCIVLLDNSGDVEKIRGAGVSINERINAEAEIKRLAYFDALTGLPNRRMILDSLRQTVAAAKRRNSFGALLFFDLDRFKNLNDSLGHDAGDELLKLIAQRLKEQIREEDIAARLGGDEFIVLLTHLGNSWEEAANHARRITEKMLAALRAAYRIKNSEYFSSSSIGITLFPQLDADAEALIKQADTALYRAKDAGRDNLQFFHPEMQSAANERLEIEKQMRAALAAGQLRIYYQPQFNSSGELLGMEALLRCPAADGNFIPMEKFIPIAEETGLIVAMGNWLLETACRQFRQWKEGGIVGNGGQLCINISPKQFNRRDFVETIGNILCASGLQPSLLVVEVTEKLLFTDFATAAEKMRRIQQLGVKVAVDDFGTGYSSLSCLKDLPLSQLKIDNSFIERIEKNADDRAIVETIIAMGRYLALNIIAEGVETKEQLKFLKSKGCHNYQGYYFSHPLDAEAFETFIKQRE